jgi:transcriptional regulator with XRE-family HTH domain
MLGSLMRKIRKQQGVTIPELSKKTGLSLSFLSYFENNQRNTTGETLKTIASALGLTQRELEEIKIDAKLKEIGMTSPEFTMMFKEIAIGKMTLDEKRKIKAAYELIRDQRKKDEHKEGSSTSRLKIRP